MRDRRCTKRYGTPHEIGRLFRVRSESGSVIPLVALLMVASAGIMVLIGLLGGAVNRGAQAQTAADAAALAGAAAGDSAARAAADANGAQILSIDHLGQDVRVRVRAGDRQASAQATAGSDAR